MENILPASVPKLITKNLIILAKTCNNPEDAETKSVTWKMRQDPKPVTADDVLSTWNVIKDPDNGTWISGSDYIARPNKCCAKKAE